MTVIQPGSNDVYPILVNEQEKLYDKGFGRRYTSSAAKSLFQCAWAGAKACPKLICNRKWSLLNKSLQLTGKAFVIGAAKLFSCIIADPLKKVAEFIEQKRCPEGRTAIILVDAQKGFTDKGSQTVDGVEHTYANGGLPVKGGFEIVNPINRLIMNLRPGNIVAASKDFHPKGHKSFASSHQEKNPLDQINLNGLEQTLWPNHCIQGTSDTDLLPGLLKNRVQYTVHKGLDLWVDSYGAFADNGGKNESALDEWLKGRNVKHLVVVGIATDYCVKFTALQAIAKGYQVTLVEDACRGVDPETIQSAIKEMTHAGVTISTTDKVINTKPFINEQ